MISILLGSTEIEASYVEDLTERAFTHVQRWLRAWARRVLQKVMAICS